MSLILSIYLGKMMTVVKTASWKFWPWSFAIQDKPALVQSKLFWMKKSIRPKNSFAAARPNRLRFVCTYFKSSDQSLDKPTSNFLKIPRQSEQKLGYRITADYMSIHSCHMLSVTNFSMPWLILFNRFFLLCSFKAMEYAFTKSFWTGRCWKKPRE